MDQLDNANAVRSKPTISDVAALAGVSRAVASRALSSEPRPVAADKRERVLKAAQSLGFMPNALARSLSTNTVNLVAIVVNHIHDLSDLDLFDDLLNEIQLYGKQVIWLRLGSLDRIEEFFRNGIAYHVDAALVFSDFTDAATARRMFNTDQVLMLNGRHDAFSPSVLADETTGISQAVADAAIKGVRSVLLVSGRQTSPIEAARIDCYRREFQSHAMHVVDVVQGDYSYESGRSVATNVLQKNAIDAVFCTSDAMAMGVLDVCRAEFPNHRPTGFRLYGFDNLSLTRFDAYPIASIGFDKSQYVKAVLQLLMNPKTSQTVCQPVLIPTQFFPRPTAG